jgi:hypothetical protein
MSSPPTRCRSCGAGTGPPARNGDAGGHGRVVCVDVVGRLRRLAGRHAGPLFDWYDSGDVEVRTARDDLTFHLTPQSAAHWAAWVGQLGALVVGRRLFDLTDGW